MSKILLIDGYSIINRAFYALPILTNPDGQPTNGVYGFLNICLKIIEEEQPDYLAVAFDVKKPTFRHEMYEAYKGTRKPMPTELTVQVPALKELLSAMEIPCIEKPGYEADDIIGTISRICENKDMDVTVLSGDRDLLQLATKRVKIRIPKTSKGKTEIYDYYEDDVKNQYGVTPIQFIDMKALMGDASDNIPGLPGVGEKTAGKLIADYGSIENCYEHFTEIKPAKAMKAFEEHYDLAVLSKKLATIEVNAPIDFDLEAARMQNIFTPKAYEIIKYNQFKSLIGHFSEELKEHAVKKEDKCIVLEEFDEICDYRNRLLKNAAKKDHFVGFTLLTGKDNEILGAGICESEEESVFIPVVFFINDVWMQDLLYDLLKTGNVCFLDAKEQMYLLEPTHRYEEFHFFDAGIAAYLLNPLKSSYSYEELAMEQLSLSYPSIMELFGKKSLSDVKDIDPEKLSKYGCYMARCAFLLRKPLLEKLKEENMLSLYDNIELPLVSCLFRMEQNGVIVKKDLLESYSKELAGKIEVLEKTIHEEAGEPFNINSPKQLGEILFEKMGMKGGKKTKTGYSTAADVLEKLAAEHEIVKNILEYRQLAKLKSTYADGLTAFIQEDGRIHGKFNQTVTATGRISSTEPNLQNIPIRLEMGREIRKVFVPAEGYVFLDADYSQIELRILAHLSGDENLIQAYRECKDIHASTASQVFHVPLEEVTSKQRRDAKAVNFGIVYGISAFGLSEDLSISRKEAEQYIEQYFKVYPKVKEYLDRQVELAKNQGFVTTMYDRRRPIPELKSSNFMQRSFGERVAMNSPIQGTAADIMKIAMIRVEQALREQKLASRIILQVHDEIVIETKEDEIEAVKKILESEMQNSFQLSVPLLIDVKEGKSWFETK